MKQALQMAAVAALAARLSGESPLRRPRCSATTTGSSATVALRAQGFLAEAFNPSADSDFSGAGVFVQNTDVPGGSETFSVTLYSAAQGGAPGAKLWTSGALSAPASETWSKRPITAPIALNSGTEYLLALDLPDNDVAWLSNGSRSLPYFASNDGGVS